MYREYVVLRFQQPNPCQQDNDEFLLQKFVMVGDSGVGKTSFLRRYTEDVYDDLHDRTTIGVDFKIKRVVLHGVDTLIKQQIWDVAGPERFRHITRAYFRGAHGLFCMFDLSDRDSFVSAIEHWYPEIKPNAMEDTQVILLGMKRDLVPRSDHPEITAMRLEAQAFAQSNGMEYTECSARTGEGVEAAVVRLTRRTVSIEQHRRKTQVEADLLVERPHCHKPEPEPKPQRCCVQ